MMEAPLSWLHAVVFGVIQGATEYIPVSSTAHLLLAPWLLGWPSPSAAFNIVVQMGTLVAVVWQLRDDLWRILTSSLHGLWQRQPLIDDHAREGWLIVMATLPAVVAGLLFKDAIEAQMGQPRQVLWQLLINGVMLCAADAWSRRHSSRQQDHGRLLAWQALAIGVAQAVAILPSISRSGATMAMAIVLGMSRGGAARFSFLLSVPVMLGAGILSLKDLFDDPALVQREAGPLLLATLVAGITGWWVIRWLQRFVRTHSLAWFGGYCIVVAAVALWWWPAG
jgi:undecaprenyl-diphosphatase